MTETKSCSKCGEEKALDAFYTHKVYGRRAECNACNKAYRSTEAYKAAQRIRSKNWRVANPKSMATVRRKNHLKKYGLTPERYAEMLAQQSGGCAICTNPPEESPKGVLFVDHDHKSGAVRKLLCGNCNNALGHMRDDPALLERAAAYLRGRV